MIGGRSRSVQIAAVVLLATASGVTISLLRDGGSTSPVGDTPTGASTQARTPSRGPATIASAMAPGASSTASPGAPQSSADSTAGTDAQSHGAVATRGHATTPIAAPAAASAVHTATRRRTTTTFTPSTGGLKLTTSFAYRNAGSQRLGAIKIPQPSMLLWTADGNAPFALRAAGPTTVKIRSTHHAGREHLAKGTYADLRVSTTGPWTIQILPDVAR